tara:strand:+ start:877 stop:1068 length:192 start_codon:yes stop_codon:yes gene_type:complete
MQRVIIETTDTAITFSVNVGTEEAPDWFKEQIPQGRDLTVGVAADGKLTASVSEPISDTPAKD